MKKNFYKIVMCACAEVGAEMVDYLYSQGIIIDYIVTISQEQALKNKVSGFFDFNVIHKKYDIPIYFVDKYSLKSDNDQSFFDTHKFDLLIFGGWQRLIPDVIIKTLKYGGIGIHGSSELLPYGRGRSPINWSIIEGKKRFIIHTFLINPGVDDGDIYDYEMFEINDWDSCKTIYYKYSIVSKRLLTKNIKDIFEAKLKSLPQVGESTYFPKRTPEDGEIDWSKTVFEIYNFIRAITHPYPGAFSYIQGVKIFIWEAQPFDTMILYADSIKGQIVEFFMNGDFVVNCYSGLLLVTKYTIEGANIELSGEIFHKKLVNI
jgi:methionyl-tRNA formyltransferase